MNERRVVVTGTGALSCAGHSAAELWDAMLNGRCGIGKVTRFDATEYRSQIAGEVKDFDVSRYMGPKESKRMDLFCQYAVAASEEALQQAGMLDGSGCTLPEEEKARFGVLVSSGIGGLTTICEQHQILLEKGPGRVSPLMIPMMIGDIASGHLAMRYGLKGPNFGLVSACSSGCHSIGEAFWIIKRNDADMMLTGGAEATMIPLGYAGFCSMKAMSTRNDDPLHASRPFDADRDGFVMSEGSGVLVLEEYEHAKKRGAVILAEILGYGATGDAFHITSPHPEGEGAARAITMALGHAGIAPDEVDYINAHGTSTTLNDKYETLAIKRAFGEAAARKVSVSSTKGVTGHALGAAGGLESIACIKALQNGVVPPTINYVTPDPECDLDVTPNQPRERDLKTALNINLGFGGHNGVLVFSRYDGQ